MTNDKGKYSQYLTVAGNYFANKGWVHLLLAGGLYILYKMFFRTSLPFFLTKGNREAAKKYGSSLCSDRHTIGSSNINVYIVCRCFALCVRNA